MKCCRFFVLFVAILLLIEGYDAGDPPSETTVNKKSKKRKKHDETFHYNEIGNCRNGKLYEVGYKKKSDSPGAESNFVKVYEVCHDPVLLHTYYTYSTISSGEKKIKYKGGFKRLEHWHGIEMSSIYCRDDEQKTIARLLGSEDAGKYIDTDSCGPLFLSKGHLMAKSDVNAVIEQQTTCTYLNAVPMWQSINGGNWETMERAVRKLNENKNFTLEVWTGSIGILTLKNENDDYKEIYLYVKGSIRKVPVPKLLYKVVYKEEDNSGIVFVTLNNPYEEILSNKLKICTDVCEKSKLFSDKPFSDAWAPTVGKLGHSYCCTIEEFCQKEKDNAPEKVCTFEDVGLLKASEAV